MNKISISEAARIAGISRQHLYKAFINTGKISVIRDNEKVYIEASELLRVFPDCKQSETPGIQKLTNESDSKLQQNDEIITMLKAQLAEAKEREQQIVEQSQKREDWLKQQIDELRQQQSNLLENKTAKKRKKFLGIF